jgi:hypothetical protein
MAAQDPVERKALHIAEQAAFLKSILESSTEYSIIAKDWTYAATTMLSTFSGSGRLKGTRGAGKLDP